MEKFRQNIFGIGEVYELQKEGQWIEKNRESFREYGYFGGGEPTVSTVDRIDYSNDTASASVRGPLSSAKSTLAATGNSNFGYFGGGQETLLSTVDRIDYSNDSATASVRGPLSLARRLFVATGNSNFGWFVGGHLSSADTSNINLSISTVDRINFSNDLSTASIRGNLNQRRTNHSIAGNANYGWIAGGNRATNDTLYYSSVERIDYSNDNILMSLRGLAPDGTGQGGSATGNNNFGYYHRGVNPASIFRSEVNRIDYSNDLVNASVRAFLSISNTSRAATGNSNFGYFSGGLSVPGFNPRSSTERIDYSNDTATASIRGPLSSERAALAATSSASFGGSPVSYLGATWTSTAPFGYFGGGASPSVVSTIDRVDYTNDTNTALTRGPLTTSRSNLAASGNSNFGYFCGGLIPSPESVSLVDRIGYANDTDTASIRGNLLVADRDFSATGNLNFAYIAGGNAASTTIYRIQYSNDFVNAISRGTLSGARRYNSAISSPNFAYYAGNFTTIQSVVDRIDYSNDNITTLVRGPLSTARHSLAASGNSNFGYYGGGSAPALTSRVDRIDYATDTSTALIRGPLSVSKTQLSGTGSSGFGYFGGGAIPGLSSVVERIDYSNDTQIASVRQGGLSVSRNLLAASSSQAFGGSPNTSVDPLPAYIRSATKFDDSNTLDLPFKRVLGSYGYYAGAFPNGSIVNRIDFSNDTAAASRRGDLSPGSSEFGGCSNSNFGYYGGGEPSTQSTVRRIDFSNDSANTLIRGPLSQSRRRVTGTGNSNFGYMVGGSPGVGELSTIDRIDYSNDSATASRRGPLGLVRAGAVWGGTGNSNFGYFGGDGPTRIDRIDYSNDLALSSVRGPINSNRGSGTGATGNSNFGYFCGGRAGSPTFAQFTLVDRIDYSNDTATASIRGPLSAGGSTRATGNSNFGYVNIIGPIRTIVTRIDYSNDTATSSVRGPLSSTGYSGRAVTNARNS